MRRETRGTQCNRREFLKRGGAMAAGASALGGFLPSGVFASDDNTIRLALIGCGGRGSGAVGDALSVADEGPIKLWAMADLDKDRMTKAHDALKESFADKVDVAEDRRFAGFDAYRRAIDILRPGDIAMCTTRPYIRPLHVEYAVKKGVNVFMEKSFASDPAGVKRMLRAGEEAEKKGVKVLAGLQCRHSPARAALIEKIRAGEMGEIHTIRANRWGGARWLKANEDGANDLLGQLRLGKTHIFWVGSGQMVDNLIHQVDECCWIKDAWPVSVEGLSGRVAGSQDAGQNLDIYSMEYTFADGTKAFCGFRRMEKCRAEFATFVHGTKCAAQFSGMTHAATVQMFKDQRIGKEHVSWTPERDKFSPWQYEWNNFIRSIRKDRPHNEVKRACYSDLATLMGRAACHTGQVVTWDEIMASEFQFCDYLDTLSYDSPPPVRPGEDGRFPVPVPGKWKEV
ncbi:MAG: Gfo/Idh/MocA family oxidoreductase [Verrucomicrobiae bacterium]|nr:Gfo/Idh/MocA family oxidoreductase [Verrucomicrobiae bacterium]